MKKLLSQTLSQQQYSVLKQKIQIVSIICYAYGNSVSRLIMYTGPKSITSASSFLKRASISRNRSEVTVNCEVAAGYPEASCVLVYREYSNSTLIVIEFPIKSFQLLDLFPVPLPVITPENYTFAIFGKNGVEMEEEPAFIVKFKKSSTPQPSPGQLISLGITIDNNLTCIYYLWYHHQIRCTLVIEPPLAIVCLCLHVRMWDVFSKLLFLCR